MITPAGRIGFLFKAGRNARAAMAGPTEFFYGYDQFRQAGSDVHIVTDSELGLDRLPARWWRAISHVVFTVTGVPLWPVMRLAGAAARQRLNEFDVLIVSTNTFGVCLAVLRTLGLIRPRILFIAMGLIEPDSPGRIVACYRWIFGSGVTISALSEQDARMLSGRLRRPVRHFPFGVDASFWVPGPSTPTGDYVLSIGNDSHRDYVTLLNAWQAAYPQLRIVTKHELSTNKANVTIQRGDWHQQTLSDEDIRNLFQRARFVVLPIVNTIQPSGQSVTLQAMACAKAVAITDFPGLWNRELLRDGETCVLGGPPGDVVGLQRAIERLLSDVTLSRQVGERARAVIERHLNVERMAERIAADISASSDDIGSGVAQSL